MCKGVIRGIVPCDGPEELDRKIVNSKNPLALGATLWCSTATRCQTTFRTAVRSSSVPYIESKWRCATPVVAASGIEQTSAPVQMKPLYGGRHFTAVKERNQRYQMSYLVRRRRRERSRANRSKSPAFAKGERQLPEISGRSGARGSSISRNPSPSVTPGRSRSPSRERSRSRGRSRRRSRRRSGSRSVSRARSGSSVGQTMKRKSTLSWADRVRGGGETGPSRGSQSELGTPR
ncbi:hypothetical protein HPB49_011893 [Dermacentor silvarum]|uniref:Uncharacterized protein n=1 Tax=Dermacentor silvarum TaxID=543639 RepID=A0ACB8CKN0_DERSI|nr:hypothetical protein HPB49_011893 [Dermacentor silvarum]